MGLVDFDSVTKNIQTNQKSRVELGGGAARAWTRVVSVINCISEGRRVIRLRLSEFAGSKIERLTLLKGPNR